MKQNNKISKAKILIIVRGGVVQNVFASNDNVEVDLLDFDSETFSSEEQADLEYENRKAKLKRVI